MRAVAVTLLLVALPALAGCYHQEPAEFPRPEWRAGDTWEMVGLDAFGGVAQIHYTALGPGPRGTWQFLVKPAGAPEATMYLHPDALRFSDQAEVAAREPHWPWPLEDGETWSFEENGEPWTAVARRENTRAEFGEVKAMRVTFSNATQPVQDMWYAPEARFWARVVDHPTGTATVLAAYGRP